jgi:SNF2 family DNA or RNA helicase
MLSHTLNKLNTTKLQFIECEQSLNQIQLKYNNMLLYSTGIATNNEDSIDYIKDRLTTTKHNHTRLINTLDALERSYNYLKLVVDSLTSDESECPICLDTIERLTLTKCGHKFCWECLYETHKIKNNLSIKCPTCNTLLKNSEIYIIESQKQQECTERTELDFYVDETKSSKIGNIIYFLKNCKDTDKIIVFSQWDDILNKIGDFLKKFNLNFVYCTGTVYNKKKVIKQFTSTSEINIILLSSRNSASGINLIAANKILLVEPVYGSPEYRQNIEAQAIGRADRIGQQKPIDVHRFIIKDTIEEQIYNNDPAINIHELTI